MAFLIGDNTLFLHVPKTAGMAIVDAFERAGVRVIALPSPGVNWRHANERQLMHVPPCYEWNFRFGFIRHPVDWWYSIWKFTHTPNSKMLTPNPQELQPFAEIYHNCKRYHGRGPDTFVEKMVFHHPSFYSRLVDSMFGADQEVVDFIGNYERIERHLSMLCGERDLPDVTLSAENVSEPPENDGLSDHVVDLVCESEAKIIEEFYGDYKP